MSIINFKIQIVMKRLSILFLVIAAILTGCGDSGIKDKLSQQKLETGVVINGVTWATRNVDAPGTFAESPESPGMFYQWGKKVGWNCTNPPSNTQGGSDWDYSYMPGTAWQSENNPCPPGWRVPTERELNTLLDDNAIEQEWVTVNGVKGCYFTDNISGNGIFLPAAGVFKVYGGAAFYFEARDLSFRFAGYEGLYWVDGGTGRDPGTRASLELLPYRAGKTHVREVYGASVRCVAE